jgi:hypothetical protein
MPSLLEIDTLFQTAVEPNRVSHDCRASLHLVTLRRKACYFPGLPGACDYALEHVCSESDVGETAWRCLRCLLEGNPQAKPTGEAWQDACPSSPSVHSSAGDPSPTAVPAPASIVTYAVAWSRLAATATYFSLKVVGASSYEKMTLLKFPLYHKALMQLTCGTISEGCQSNGQSCRTCDTPHLTDLGHSLSVHIQSLYCARPWQYSGKTA